MLQSRDGLLDGTYVRFLSVEVKRGHFVRVPEGGLGRGGVRVLAFPGRERSRVAERRVRIRVLLRVNEGA